MASTLSFEWKPGRARQATQARRSLEQLRQMGLPPPSADAGSGGLAPASMFRELQELRASEEQKRRMLAAAALVVS